MKFNLQSKLGAIALSLLLLVGILPMQGCTNQTTVAALVTTLGNAASAIAALEGNSTLATKLKADTAAASTAVLNWKNGTPAQSVVEALTIVEDDLNLIPIGSRYTPLVTLALGTVISIIQILNPGSTPVAAARGRRTVILAHAPKDSKQFKAQWNATAKEYGLVGVSIQ